MEEESHFAVVIPGDLLRPVTNNPFVRSLTGDSGFQTEPWNGTFVPGTARLPRWNIFSLRVRIPLLWNGATESADATQTPPPRVRRPRVNADEHILETALVWFDTRAVWSARSTESI